MCLNDGMSVIVMIPDYNLTVMEAGILLLLLRDTSVDASALDTFAWYLKVDVVLSIEDFVIMRVILGKCLVIKSLHQVCSFTTHVMQIFVRERCIVYLMVYNCRLFSCEKPSTSSIAIVSIRGFIIL